ncbi:MAG: CPBP family intramembrane metalloprotease [bacterium]|nr:CPBP family intramembrane metalloprotease [bacterium]
MIVFFFVRCIIAPITEEIVFRFGLFEFLFSKRINKKLILLIVSFIFALIHWYSLYNTLVLLALSFIWTFSYYKKQNLVYPILLHLIHNLYAMLSYIPFSTNVFIIFGIMCFALLLITLIIKKKWLKTTS